jgi:malonyl CoA-acyl carrier protein transacylase
VTLASIFGTNLFHYQPDGVIAFHDTYPAVRESFARAAEWTGIDEETLLYQKGDHDQAERVRIASIGLAAAQLGIQDVLVEQGLRPRVVGGLSLGGLVSSCVAGAIDRRDLIELLATGEHKAEDDLGRPQTIAAAYLPLDVDPYEYADREGIFLSSDFGCDASGRIRIVLLSGFRDALERLAASEPDGMINITEGVDIAVHSPLRERARVQSRPRIDAIRFADPVLTLCSCLEQRTVTTAGDVRDMFTSNVVKPISLVHLNAEMRRHGTQLGIVVGPSPVMNALRYPFPVVFVDSPAGIPQTVAAVFEHGISL